MAGLETSGFVAKDFETLKAEIEAAEKAVFGASINTLGDSVFGQLNSIFTERLVELWLLAKAVYNSQYPDTADGVSLDNVAAITGAIRLAATKSTVNVVAVGTTGVLLPPGRVVSVVGTGARFVSNATATIATLSAWTPTTTYAVGDLRTNGGNIYSCTTAGTSAASGGPSGTGTSIVDGSVVWRFIAAGAAAVNVSFESEGFGPIIAAAGTLTSIETSVSGWTSAVNPLDAENGRNIESDVDFRVRREELLQRAGAATVEAIRADLLTLTGVSEAIVLENVTLVTDANGLPAKSFEAIVSGGVDQDIRDQIFASKPAGIEAHGTISGTITDSMGFSHTIKFSRPTTKDVFIIIDVIAEADDFPSDGAAQIKQALVDFGEEEYQIGDDVIASKLKCEAFNVSGVLDVTNFLLGFSSPPTLPNNLTIGIREIADLDTSRITVNVTLV